MALDIVLKAKLNDYAIAREDLTGLIEALRKLLKGHKVKIIPIGE